jgi:hypothetical protein
MKPTIALLTVIAALLAAGCGGDDKDEGSDKPAPVPSAGGSSIKCLTLSTLSPELYEDGAGVEKGVEPLLTGGAKGAEILTGKVAAVVIEYPDSTAAVAAHHRALESKVLKKYVKQSQIQAYGSTLFIDYSKEPHVRKIVLACANRPDQPPPTP